MALLTLAEAKTDLRVEGNDEDADVTLKMEAATEIVIDYIKQPDHTWTAADCPFLIKAAVMLVLRNLYDAQDAHPLTEGVKAILHRFRDPALA